MCRYLLGWREIYIIISECPVFYLLLLYKTLSLLQGIIIWFSEYLVFSFLLPVKTLQGRKVLWRYRDLHMHLHTRLDGTLRCWYESYDLVWEWLIRKSWSSITRGNESIFLQFKNVFVCKLNHFNSLMEKEFSI